MNEATIKAWTDTRTLPCDYCNQVDLCKTKEWACGLFEFYARDNPQQQRAIPQYLKTRAPNKASYDKVFNLTDE
jgi:hypothetical protein